MLLLALQGCPVEGKDGGDDDTGTPPRLEAIVSGLPVFGNALDGDGDQLAVIDGATLVVLQTDGTIDFAATLPTGRPLDVQIEDGAAYVAFESIGDKSETGGVGVYVDGDEVAWIETGNTHTVLVADGILYAANPLTYSVVAYDVSDPADPKEVGEWVSPTISRPDEMALWWDTLYVTAASGKGIGVADVSDPAAMTTLGWVSSSSGGPHNVTATDGTLYTSDEYTGGYLRGWSAADPANLTPGCDIEETSYPMIYGVATAGDRLYGAWYESGLLVWDVSDPLDPTPLDGFDACDCVPNGQKARGINAVWAEDDTVVVLDTETGLYVLGWTSE